MLTPSPVLLFRKCEAVFDFGMFLCELTLFLPCQSEEMASQQGLLVQPLFLMLHHWALLRWRGPGMLDSAVCCGLGCAEVEVSAGQCRWPNICRGEITIFQKCMNICFNCYVELANIAYKHHSADL